MTLNNIKNIGIKYKIILTLFTNSLIIISIIYFIIIPRVGYIKESGRQIIRRRVFLEEQYIKVRRFMASNKDMNLVDADIQKLDEVFVDYDKDLQFIETLEKVAIDNNINQRISLGSIKNEGSSDFERITLEISADGNFLNIMNYLISLETLNYYINISSLDIYKPSTYNINNGLLGDEPNSLSRVICKITADTYWK